MPWVEVVGSFRRIATPPGMTIWLSIWSLAYGPAGVGLSLLPFVNRVRAGTTIGGLITLPFLLALGTTLGWVSAIRLVKTRTFRTWMAWQFGPSVARSYMVQGRAAAPPLLSERV